ncbi:MAG TPA: lysophospholipid acyltransferase family protein [Acidimicrobiales bacterium]|nr:lysophospholipid acyltransferase family protein [Acidimicrobiales bacterium]
MAYWVLKVVLTPVFRLAFRVRVEGRHHVPRRGPAILAANHQAFCDSLFLPLAVARKVTYLAKAEYFDDRRSAWFFRAVGQIPIRRGGGPLSERALATAREALGAGRVLALYPEGTRSTDEFVHRGRTGVARLAAECGVPIIPVGIEGTTAVQPIGRRYLRPFRRVTIRFGPPIELERPSAPDAGLRTDDDRRGAREATDRLMREISRLSGRSYLDEYVPARTGAPRRAA